MRSKNRPSFDPETFLARAGLGRTLVDLRKKGTIFSQGDRGSAIFYIQKGRVKLTVVSKAGKEATIALLAAGDFLGEECVAVAQSVYLATATAMTQCSVLRIERKQMARVLHQEHAFSDLFVGYLLGRNSRSTSFLTPVKNGLPGFCYCSRILGRTEDPRL